MPPIRSRIVRHADDYPYSSFRAFYPDVGDPAIAVDADWWWEDEPAGQPLGE